jgi:hypothetical protein
MSKETKRAKQKKVKQPLPPQPLLMYAPADNGEDPFILSKPPVGKSGNLRVRKPIHDALCADPKSLDPHVSRLTAHFGQDITGLRIAYLRLTLDAASPTLKDLGEKRLVNRVRTLTAAGEARLANVLGKDFHASVFFGGKHFRP